MNRPYTDNSNSHYMLILVDKIVVKLQINSYHATVACFLFSLQANELYTPRMI